MEKGDILLLSNGRLARIISDVSDSYVKGLMEIQFLDRDEPSFMDPEDLDVEENLGSGSATLCQFYTARSIHLRLNRMNKV